MTSSLSCESNGHGRIVHTFVAKGIMRRESVSTNPASWRKFLAVHSLASIAEGLSLTYLPIVVLAATGSTALTSLVVFLRTLPVLIGVIPAGSLADSGRRARTMQMGNSVGVLGATLLSVEAFLGTTNLSREQIREALTAVHPSASNYLIGNWTGQLDRFVNEMQVGDIVVMPLKSDGSLAIGTV